MYSLPHRFLYSVLDGVFHFFRCERGAAVGLRHNFIERFLHEGIKMGQLPHLRLERLLQLLGRLRAKCYASSVLPIVPSKDGSEDS